MQEAAIVSYARTPIGKAFKGAYRATHGASLGGHVVRHAMQRAGVPGDAIDDVILGCAFPEGPTASISAASVRWRLGCQTAFRAPLSTAIAPPACRRSRWRRRPSRPVPSARPSQVAVSRSAACANILHGEQRFEYHAVARIGDELHFAQRIKDTCVMKGGALGFVVRESLVTRADGAHVATLQNTTVVRHG